MSVPASIQLAPVRRSRNLTFWRLTPLVGLLCFATALPARAYAAGPSKKPTRAHSRKQLTRSLVAAAALSLVPDHALALPGASKGPSKPVAGVVESPPGAPGGDVSAFGVPRLSETGTRPFLRLAQGDLQQPTALPLQERLYRVKGPISPELKTEILQNLGLSDQALQGKTVPAVSEEVGQRAKGYVIALRGERGDAGDNQALVDRLTAIDAVSGIFAGKETATFAVNAQVAQLVVETLRAGLADRPAKFSNPVIAGWRHVDGTLLTELFVASSGQPKHGSPEKRRVFPTQRLYQAEAELLKLLVEIQRRLKAEGSVDSDGHLIDITQIPNLGQSEWLTAPEKAALTEAQRELEAAKRTIRSRLTPQPAKRRAR